MADGLTAVDQDQLFTEPHRYFRPVPKRCHYCYGAMQPLLQELPQFGAGGDNVTLGDVVAAMFGVKNAARQRGGNFMREMMLASQPKTIRRQRGGAVAMPAWLDQLDRAIRGYHIPSSHVKGSHTKRQRGAGVFSFLISPLFRFFGKKVTKQAAKTVAKRVAKKAAKKAAKGALTASASWATQKALDRI